MKILDWIKNLFKNSKKGLMLNESNHQNGEKTPKANFVPKVDINNMEFKNTRENVIRSLRKDIIVKDLSEQYNYGKFSRENIKNIYDQESLLSDEDITAISCLYGAIKDGNYNEFNYLNENTNNNIINFLEENPNNIVVLINLMIEDARKLYNTLGDDKLNNTTISGLISGSYGEISKIIEEYKEKELSDVELTN